jgi:hypothetical protein
MAEIEINITWDRELLREGVRDLLRLLAAFPPDSDPARQDLYRTELASVLRRIAEVGTTEGLEAQFNLVANELHVWVLAAKALSLVISSAADPATADPSEVVASLAEFAANDQEMLKRLEDILEEQIEGLVNG